MNLKTLSISIILASLPTSAVFAAALDRSGQSIQAFLQPGNYFEAGISVLDADVSGKVKDGWTPANQSRGQIGGTDISDMAESYQFYNAALKVQMTENVSFGLIYDQPFGAKAQYSTNDKTHTNGPSNASPNPTSSAHNLIKNSGAFHNGTEGTNVDVETQNLSMIFGFQPIENFNIYAGGVYQTIKGNVSLRGTAYGPFGSGLCANEVACGQPKDKDGKITPYDAKISEDSAVGWLAGFAYQIPEIALKASLTYRSEIKHKVNVDENIGGIKILTTTVFDPKEFTEGVTDITTPQSVNLDLQSGIMENTVAFAQLRWVDWSNFSIKPHKFGQLGDRLAKANLVPNQFGLVAYDKDQISANVGVGRKFNDQWAGSVMVGWDSGAGNPISTLGPTEGYWSTGLGVQFSPTKDSFIQAGAKYFWLGDAKSQVASDFGTKNYAADFKDNHAIGYSLKIGHRF
ncbi:outer membrane protein transport protein [Acinetobacter shaoyimingii]|uniref:Transporter n=1 Tax=Acinetobacter shaoyimingii TaxID=2715164 RepID=A0A6G8RXN0_9GAMM|nr:outer membrane protein transport protein [Acinetobacter shaoyimingii]QIO06625.1 transporter [Acinetobacter shaoyimingii]